MQHVVYKEIFELVGYGFSAEYLEKIPITLRRFFFVKYQERLQAQAGNTPKPKNPKQVTFDPVKRGE